MAACLAAVLACIACSADNSLMPDSGGRPYEVLVTGADSEAVALVAEALRQVEMAGLPQHEPSFDVSTLVSSGLNQFTRYARNIVMVATGIDTLNRPTLHYTKNAYARKQLLVQLRTRNTTQLRTYIKYNVRAMEQLLVTHELNNGISTLRDKHNREAEQQARAMFGIRLWVPEDLTRWKRGHDFLWLSNDAAQGMQNICVYKYAGHTYDKATAVAKRDSVMKANLPGESAGSHVTTVDNSTSFHTWPANAQQGDAASTVLRGLWAMKGEPMGGPFVSRSMVRGDSTIVVEAFVYAPGMKKRNLIRRIEPSLYSMKE